MGQRKAKRTRHTCSSTTCFRDQPPWRGLVSMVKIGEITTLSHGQGNEPAPLYITQLGDNWGNYLPEAPYCRQSAPNTKMVGTLQKHPQESELWLWQVPLVPPQAFPQMDSPTSRSPSPGQLSSPSQPARTGQLTQQPAILTVKIWPPRHSHRHQLPHHTTYGGQVPWTSLGPVLAAEVKTMYFKKDEQVKQETDTQKRQGGSRQT